MGEADENSSESFCAQLHALTTIACYIAINWSEWICPLSATDHGLQSIVKDGQDG